MSRSCEHGSFLMLALFRQLLHHLNIIRATTRRQLCIIAIWFGHRFLILFWHNLCIIPIQCVHGFDILWAFSWIDLCIHSTTFGHYIPKWIWGCFDNLRIIATSFVHDFDSMRALSFIFWEIISTSFGFGFQIILAFLRHHEGIIETSFGHCHLKMIWAWIHNMWTLPSNYLGIISTPSGHRFHKSLALFCTASK